MYYDVQLILNLKINFFEYTKISNFYMILAAQVCQCL